MFNVPRVVVAAVAAMALVHALRAFLSPREDVRLLLRFAFIPSRYDPALLSEAAFPGGRGAEVWTFVTYAFLHGDLTHLVVNLVWLLAFGTPVARRFGPLRFVLFSAVTAAAGAAMHLATHTGASVPMVGASAAISGYMAGAIRFIFAPVRWRVLPSGRVARDQTAAPLLVTLRDSRVLIFLGVWFGLNVLLGLGSFAILGEEQSVAWQAHIGGFLAGLLLFPVFDPVNARLPDDDAAGPDAEAAPP